MYRARAVITETI